MRVQLAHFASPNLGNQLSFSEVVVSNWPDGHVWGERGTRAI